ncbi:hypothetical protein ACIQ1J_13995 [Streptomyces sp. NPDC097107]|uniref:hypothetical protein n=1 Tax=Streptomyces sp. NPDC097107 TaxID=3366089 RepID=UPI00380D760A
MRRRSADPVGAARQVGPGTVEGAGVVRPDGPTATGSPSAGAGRLSPYVPADCGLVRWTETVAGGTDWSGPRFVPVAGLTHLTVVQGADSYVHFLGRRERERADGGLGVDVEHAIQYQTGFAVDAVGNESAATPVPFAVVHVTAGATPYGY